MLTNDVFSKIEAYSYDYEYLLQKYDLVNRRKNGEFDQVWLYTIDPVQTFETTMVGNKPYWINGSPIIKDCDNFVLANVSISRRDANLHALGHGVEGIMSMAFNGTYFSYNKNYNDTTESKYQNLNLWEKFSMADYESKGQNAGVGNVHFPFNGVKDYDYNNTNKVYSYWKNWLNYPDLNGEKALYDSSAFIEWEGNKLLSGDQNRDNDRLYMRFWFYLFPHVEGVTEDGYLNNWWKYFCTLDYVDKVECIDYSKEYNEVDEIVDLRFKSTSYFGKEKIVNLNNSDIANFKVSNEKIIEYDESGKVLIKNEGTAQLYCYRDGKFDAYDIVVTKGKIKFNVYVTKHE